MSRTRIDVEEVVALHNRFREINNLEIRSVEFYYKGVKLEIPQEAIEEWRFTGLGLMHFVELGMDLPK